MYVVTNEWSHSPNAVSSFKFERRRGELSRFLMLRRDRNKTGPIVLKALYTWKWLLVRITPKIHPRVRHLHGGMYQVDLRDSAGEGGTCAAGDRSRRTRWNSNTCAFATHTRAIRSNVCIWDSYRAYIYRGLSKLLTGSAKTLCPRYERII